MNGEWVRVRLADRPVAGGPVRTGRSARWVRATRNTTGAVTVTTHVDAIRRPEARVGEPLDDNQWLYPSITPRDDRW
ncbi:hypothetical protein EV193_101661 [Herbihabitans rhizosphaerae]|uniref:Uncharacterized protein n=1 Tax=Herbihabitans rhizosphaerae TaxID=1872711 RepID=A0A4Q7L8Q1_9PSEU|nr:hypothetical protein [Herbihabitans rhizosphaerae]RZS44782.1 hypothetical protein EV193_101661 [Herbihabitans rhizosphaerae]